MPREASSALKESQVFLLFFKDWSPPFQKKASKPVISFASRVDFSLFRGVPSSAFSWQSPHLLYRIVFSRTSPSLRMLSLKASEASRIVSSRRCGFFTFASKRCEAVLSLKASEASRTIVSRSDAKRREATRSDAKLCFL